jgi:hypothetical protein
MRWFRTVILLAVPVLAVGCLPKTPAEAEAEAGVGVVLIGFCFVLTGGLSCLELLKVEESKTAARLFLGALFLIGGGLIAVGGWLAGWWGQ